MVVSAAEAPTGGATVSTETSLAQQRKSVETQRQAVRKQAAAPQPARTDDFFTTPWLTATVVPPMSIAAPDCDPMPEPELAALIDTAATRETVKPALVRAVIRQESRSRPCAVSPKGAQGLMQLMPATADRFHVTDPFDPSQNVNAGTKLLKELLTHYAGDLRLALGAYNAGPARVDQAGAVPETAETKEYVSNILKELGEEAGVTGSTAARPPVSP